MFGNFFKKNKTEEKSVDVREVQQPVEQKQLQN